MKNSINGMIGGKTVNVFINGKLRKKVCDTVETAKEFFELILATKENPTSEAIKNVFAFLNEKTRLAMQCGLETDPDTGEVYLAGFNTPVPMTLVEIIKDYYDNGYPLEPIVNFWKLLMLNPDTRVRTSLFDFITTHDFSLTDNGYMIVYKAVDYRDVKKDALVEFISNRHLYVKKTLKEAPKKHVIYFSLQDGQYHLTKAKTFAKWNVIEKEVEYVGNLNEMYTNLDDYSAHDDAPYTDWYSKTMKIKVGKAVKMLRTECDADPMQSCSYGLHVGATNYVARFGHTDSAILVCYVNPANVVAVPDYDHSKMRVTEYFPFAVATYDGSTIDVVEQKYLEDDYKTIEKEELEAMVEKVKANELPLETAKKAEEETRSFSELQKIIENRLIDLS